MNNENTTRKRGRPIGYRVENPMSKAMPKVMLTPEQLNTYKATAKQSGKTFSAWVREVLDRASKSKGK